MCHFEPAKIAKVVALQCGCLAEYPLVGQFAELKEWHIIHTCVEHHGMIKTVEVIAEEAFNNANRKEEILKLVEGVQESIPKVGRIPRVASLPHMSM